MLWLKFRGVRWYDLGGINPDSNPGGIVGVAVLRGMSWLRRNHGGA